MDEAEGRLAHPPDASELRTLVRGHKSGRKQLAEIALQCRAGERPRFIIGSSYAGSLAAFDDRCSIVKKGMLTSFMAGATFGGRTATFQYRDIVALEVNEGLVTASIEILTPSHDAAQSRDWWHISLRRDAAGNDSWTLPNVLPLRRKELQQVREQLDELRLLIAESKSDPVQGKEEASSGSLSAEIARLAELRDQGVLSETEFSAAKARLLDHG